MAAKCLLPEAAEASSLFIQLPVEVCGDRGRSTGVLLDALGVLLSKTRSFRVMANGLPVLRFADIDVN